MAVNLRTRKEMDDILTEETRDVRSVMTAIPSQSQRLSLFVRFEAPLANRYIALCGQRVIYLREF